MTNPIVLQAAVVTMLVAKRPTLADLPIDWQLSHNGRVGVDLAIGASSTAVPQIAHELARALRVKVDISEDRQMADSKRWYRSYEVRGKHSGATVSMHALEYLDEGGDVA
ncbi:hypothetical protein ACWC9Q_29610 [Streptomyces sp. NPDC001142]